MRWKEITTMTMVEVGNGYERVRSRPGKVLQTLLFQETRLGTGVAHSHRDMCRVSPGLWQSREVDG